MLLLFTTACCKTSIRFFKYIVSRLEKKEPGQTFALVVDGKTLVDVLDHYTSKFLETCLQCDAVLCCRMSPGQKADVCKFQLKFIIFQQFSLYLRLYDWLKKAKANQ